MYGRPHFIFSDIAVCNLKRSPFRTAGLISIVALLAFMLFGGSLISCSLFNGADGLAKRLGADILIVPKGYDQKIEGILLRGEPSAFFMDAAWLGKIAHFEGVRAVSPQLLIASLNASCCSMPVQLIGFDQETDFIVEPWIKTALPGRLSDGEIIIGGAISGGAGSKLEFFDREYTVVAKMENTGSGFDASVFMTMESARTAAEDFIARGGNLTLPDNAISALSIMLNEDSSPIGTTKAMNEHFGYGNSGIVVVPAKEIVSNVSGNLRALVTIIVALAAILWLLSILILAIAFSVILNERKREFGILRSLGATRRKLASLVFLESGIVSLFGGIAGVFLSALLILPFRTYIRDTINMPYMQPSVIALIGLTAGSLILSFVAGPIASLISSAKIRKSDIIDVVRDGEL
ncbi:MAG: ABC transporter permease [Clostridiales Family XIII bacterium]|nr:ABC transporter permease [Clostridiales Family XIII bacterium]